MTAPYLNTCPVGCNGPLLPTDIEMPEGSLLRCAECGQLISPCSEEKYRQSMREFDTPEGTQPKPDSSRRRLSLCRRYLEQIETLLNRPRNTIRLLDVGCSSGFFLSVAKKLGFEAEGVEPCQEAVRTARSAGLTVHEGTIERISLPPQGFDAVTLFEVIEHLRDARESIRQCNSLLRTGGILVIGTANTASWTFRAMGSQWEYLHLERHGGHVSFFNPTSMSILARQNGFVMERMRTRSVSLLDRNHSHPFLYRLSKVACEMLEMPSRLLEKGHDMVVYLRKQQDVQALQKEGS